MERHFEQELEQLKSKLLAMSALVESAVYRSITAVVQKVLGHVSVQTTERYLGCRQRTRGAVNDHIGMEP